MGKRVKLYIFANNEGTKRRVSKISSVIYNFFLDHVQQWIKDLEKLNSEAILLHKQGKKTLYKQDLKIPTQELPKSNYDGIVERLKPHEEWFGPKGSEEFIIYGSFFNGSHKLVRIQRSTRWDTVEDMKKYNNTINSGTIEVVEQYPSSKGKPQPKSIEETLAGLTEKQRWFYNELKGSEDPMSATELGKAYGAHVKNSKIGSNGASPSLKKLESLGLIQRDEKKKYQIISNSLAQ